MTSEKSTISICCPYCDTPNIISIPKNCLFFPYPPIINIKDTYGALASDKIFSELEKHRIIEKIIEEIDIQCLKCKRTFSLAVFLKDEMDPLYDDDMKKRIRYLSEKDEIKVSPPIFERFLNWWYYKQFFPFKNRLFDSYVLLVVPFFLFLIVQSTETGSIEIFKDIPFLLLFILFGLLIYVFNLFNEQFHKALNISELPLDLYVNYKKNRFGHLFEVWKIKDSIYDFWTIPIINKKVHHATAYGLIAATFYLFLYTQLVLIFHKNLFIGQSDFNFLLAISYLPLWLVICFILGNILFLLLNTAAVVSELFEKIPAKIDILKNDGGFEAIITLCNLIIFQVLILGVIAIVWLMGLIKIKFLEIDVNAFLREPVGLVLIAIIIVLMLWLYIMPMLIIVKKFQKAKSDYIDELGDKIESFYPSTYECNISELQNFQFKYNRAISLPDWPIKIKIGLIISVITPIASWIIALMTA